MTIQEEISYLANAMSDEQRKAMFAKMGGGGSGRSTPVYTMASPNGNIGGSGRNGPTGPLVATLSDSPAMTIQQGGQSDSQFGAMKLADGRVIPGDKLKDYLGSAFNEQSGVINAGLLTQKQKEEMGLVYVPSWKQGDGQVQALSLDSPRFAGLTPSDQAKQDVSSGSGGSGGGGGASGSGGSSAGGTASLPDAIDNLPSGGSSGGGSGDGGSSAPNHLQVFLDALALAHF